MFLIQIISLKTTRLMSMCMLIKKYFVYTLKRKIILLITKWFFSVIGLLFSRHGVFVGKWYICDGLFELSVIPLQEI